MKNVLFRFQFTLAAVMLAVIVLLAALIGDVNLIEMPVSVAYRIEQHEVDDVVTAFVLVVVALVVDSIRVARRGKREAKRQAELQAEQLKVVRVTMRTVQDIVNDGLNQLQMLRVDAEGLVPEESLKRFDEAIQETSANVGALGDLEVFAEKQMAVGSGLVVAVVLTMLLGVIPAATQTPQTLAKPTERVVEQFLKLAADGALLTPDCWKDAEKLSYESSDYSNEEPILLMLPAPGNTRERWMKGDRADVDAYDSIWRFRRPISEI